MEQLEATTEPRNAHDDERGSRAPLEAYVPERPELLLTFLDMAERYAGALEPVGER